MSAARASTVSHRLSANRLSLSVAGATVLAWIAVEILATAYAGNVAAGATGPLFELIAGHFALRWKFSDLPPVMTWQAIVAVIQAFILAAGFGWLLALRDGFVRWIMGADAYARLADPRALQVLCAVLFTVFLGAHLGTGLFRDYAAHAIQWSATLDGLDPWRDPAAGNNAYGPLFNVFAVAFAVNPLWPVALFLYLWFGCWLFILGRLLDQGGRPFESALFASVLFVMGPYFWVLLGFYAHFDIVPAAAALFAVHLALAKRPLGAGAILGLGVLAKFYPIIVLPFLIVRGRAIDWRPALGCALVVAVGTAVAFAIWGDSIFDPVAYAADRRTRHLSILRVGEGRIVAALTGQQFSLRALGVPLAALCGLALFAYCVWKDIDAEVGAALAPVVVLLFYPLAHFQFFAICFLLIAYWYATDRSGLFQSAGLRRATVLYLGWVSAFAVLFYLSQGHMRQDPARWVRDFAGLPAFLFGVYFVWAALRAATKGGVKKHLA
ncbi:MAG: DUF2029 domain-containing protein [Alphaproteobacteria bacterium]|nr:DUF2029 domain-containing protein [Alphaproteobacteria bacterium]